MVVYESKDSMRKNLVDKERFERFHTTLKAVGIEIRKVMGVFLENIEESEVRDIVSKKSMNALPINMYQGVSISIEDYLSDNDLTNFLDVPPPDGILDVNKQVSPAMNNNIPLACSCGNTNPEKKYNVPIKA